jgi:hypothetical protein
MNIGSLKKCDSLADTTVVIRVKPLFSERSIYYQPRDLMDKIDLKTDFTKLRHSVFKFKQKKLFSSSVVPVFKSSVEGILYCHVSHIVVTKLHVKPFIKIPSANKTDKNSSVTIFSCVSFMNYAHKCGSSALLCNGC